MDWTGSRPRQVWKEWPIRRVFVRRPRNRIGTPLLLADERCVCSEKNSPLPEEKRADVIESRTPTQVHSPDPRGCVDAKRRGRYRRATGPRHHPYGGFYKILACFCGIPRRPHQRWIAERRNDRPARIGVCELGVSYRRKCLPTNGLRTFACRANRETADASWYRTGTDSTCTAGCRKGRSSLPPLPSVFGHSTMFALIELHQATLNSLVSVQPEVNRT